MHFASFVRSGLLALGLALPVAAQEHLEPAPSPIFGFVGGGASFPLSDSGDRFDTGPAFHGGLGFNLNRLVGVQLEGFWSRYEVKSEALNASDLDATHRMQYGAIDVVANVLRGSTVSAYVLGGGGLYYRRISVTTFAGTAAVPVCDPWLGYCFTDVVAVDQVLGTRSSTDFGLNGGVGLSVRVTQGLRLYAEGRYHYIFGPEFTNAAGTQRANGEYLPVMVGLRFE